MATTARFTRDEVEAAFRTYWQTGAVREDQDACAKHDPEHPRRRSRLHWPEEPAWAGPGRRA